MNIGTMDISNLVDSMTENEAFELVFNLSRKFGWSIAGILTHEDIRYLWEASTDSEPTQEQVELVAQHYAYKKLNECVSQDINDCLCDAIFDVRRGNNETV